MNQKEGRIKSFDFFRAYGCLAIILLHVITAWRDDPTNSVAFFNATGLRMIFDNIAVPVLVRMAVPIFFMMSGALFLDPSRNMTEEKVRKHIVRLLVVLGIFGYAMAIVELIVQSKSFYFSYLWTAALNLLQEETWSHLWYLYATIGLYAITPILRAWITGADEKSMRWMIGMTILLLSIIPTVNSLSGLKITTFGITTMRGAMLCYLLGYYLYSLRDKISKLLLLLGIVWGGY